MTFTKPDQLSKFEFLIDDDPDNTVPIMLDGVESRLHIITIDTDQVCIYIYSLKFISYYFYLDKI